MPNLKLCVTPQHVHANRENLLSVRAENRMQGLEPQAWCGVVLKGRTITCLTLLVRNIDRQNRFSICPSS